MRERLQDLMKLSWVGLRRGLKMRCGSEDPTTAALGLGRELTEQILEESSTDINPCPGKHYVPKHSILQKGTA